MRVLLLVLLFAGLPATAEAVDRILALTPHACEMLYAIGAGEQLVGSVDYCDYPEQANALPRVGSHKHINVEAALRLHPDLAIVASRQLSGVSTLEKMGVTVVESNPQSFHAIFSDILKLGALTGHQRKAKALVGQLQQRLNTIRAKPRLETPVFYELWSDPLLTAGGSSFISDLIDAAGGKNVFADLGIDSPHVSVETVIRARPELIVIPLESRDIEARTVFWERWLGKGKVRFVAVNPDLLHRPGPRLLDGLELLQRAIASADKAE